MYCPNCHSTVSEGELFCGSCGARLAEAPAAPVVPAYEPAPAIPNPAMTAPVAPAPVAPAPVAPVEPTPVAPAPMGPTSEKGVNFDFSNDGATVTGGQAQRYEYKVMSQKDKWFSGKFDPELLETAINSYAQQGWRVIGCATADIPGFGGTRQEFVTLLEREV